MSRLLATVHDPWLGLCLALALGERLHGVITYGDSATGARLDAAGVEATLVPPPREATTINLLADPTAAAEVARVPGTRLLVFKPSRRLEERAAQLGASLAHPAASIAQGLENKLALAAIAAEAGIPGEPGAERSSSEPGAERIGLPAQAKIRVADSLSLLELRAKVRTDGDVVVQSPRGFMGKRTWRVADSHDWREVQATLRGRPAKVARMVEGRPGTVNAVVDHTGATLVTAPIVQVTGEPALTPFAMGSCGNDFTWRPAPHPGRGPEELVRRLGPALAARGFRGHFGIDFVVEDCPGGPVTWLIEINPRLTASMALYSAWCPVLAEAHLDAVSGSALPQRGALPPVEGGQLIVHNVGTTQGEPLYESEAGRREGSGALPSTEPCLWPHVATQVEPGGTRGRLVIPGAVVGAAGDLVVR